MCSSPAALFPIRATALTRFANNKRSGVIDADDSVRRTHAVSEDTDPGSAADAMYVNGTNNSVEAVFEEIVRERVLQLIARCVRYCQCSLLKQGTSP